MIPLAFCRYGYNFVRNYGQTQNLRMRYLNVAEKNDAAKTISGLLSNGTAKRREGYSVYNKIYEFDADVRGRKCKMVMTSVSGHLLQLSFLSTYRRWNEVDPQLLFTAPVKKICPENSTGIMRTLEREAPKCHGLIIWTDCDREGENIGFEIIEVCCRINPNIKVYRAVFSEITTASVRRALQQLTQPNKKLSDAVDVRTELDLRTGAAFTRFQTMRLQRLFPNKIGDKLISYGSCQIPTLGFVAERYKEIEAFVSEPFWKLKVLHTIGDLTVDFIWSRNRLFDKTACEDYLLLCLADPKAKVEEVTTKPKYKWRPTPLDTVEMEKLGSRKLKISAKETMTIAEKLYSRGIISYPRTETNQFSKDIDLSALADNFVPHPVWGAFAQRVKEWGPSPRNGIKTDQAHPPIHPTKLVTDLQGNDARVYELICRHFLACISKDAVGSETLVYINIAGENFTATGLCIHERNYLDIYIYDKWNAKQIHKYHQGQLFDPSEISMDEGATTAPPLLTEADLIALMEKHGIGTDATHAEHINTIKERGYIGVVGKGCLVPGIIGMGLYEGYDAMDLTLAKPLLRAEFESDLKDICSGRKDPKIVLKEQIQKYVEAYRKIAEKITAMDNKMALRINESPTLNVDHTNECDNLERRDVRNNVVREIFQCPKCSLAPLALRQKKTQKAQFIGCMNFPDCKNVIWLSEDCLDPSVLTETCQHCGPNVKLIKLKLKSAYYKTLFKTPSGWYKTCLRCDSQFREIFNINLEQVKPSGGIIGDESLTTFARIVENSVHRPGDQIIISEDNLDNSNSKSTNKKWGKSKTKLDTENEVSSKQMTAKKTKTMCTTQSIRTFFTTGTKSIQNDPAPVYPSSNATANGNSLASDLILDDFFNDDFDEMVCIGDFPHENIENTNKVNAKTSSDSLPSTSANSFSHVILNNPIINNSNKDNTEFTCDESYPCINDFVWGTTEYRRHQNTDRVSKTIQYNLGNELQHDIPVDINIQCSGCHQPAKQYVLVKVKV